MNKSKRAAINHLSQIQIKLKETGISKKSKKYKYNGQQCIIIHSKLFLTQLCVAHANGSSTATLFIVVLGLSSLLQKLRLWTIHPLETILV